MSTEGHTAAKDSRVPRRLRRAAAVAATALAATTIAACGGGSDSGDGGGASASSGSCKKVETLTVGTQPIAPLAPLYLAKSKGIFTKHGLDVQIHGNEISATAAVAAVQSGSDDVAFSDWVGVLLATNKGLPLRVIAPVAGVGSDKSKTYLATMALKDSAIKGPADLAGKTIGVNGVGNVEDISIKAALAKHGVDYKSVKFLVVPFAETQAALEQKRIDAAFFVEPFLSQGLGAGDKIVLYMAQDVMPDGALSNFFTSDKTLSSRKCAIDRFTKAWAEAEDYATSHEQEVRAALPTYTQIPKPVAAKIRLPVWGSDLSYEAGKQLGAAMVKVGALPKEPDYNAIIAYGD